MRGCARLNPMSPDIPELADPSLPQPPPRSAPWEQLPSETDLDYARFTEYVRHGGTVKTSAEMCGLAYESMRRIASRNRWSARRAAYEAEERAERRVAMRNAAERHADAMLEGWRSCMDWALESVARHRAEGRFLDPRTAAQVLKSSTEALRLLDGEPGSRVAVDLSGASLDKLDTLAELLGDVSGD